MKLLLTAILLGIGFVQPGLSQDGPRNTIAKRPRETQTARRLIERYIEALGGRTAFQRLSTLVIRGSYEEPTGGEGTYECYAKVGDKLVTTIRFVLPGDERTTTVRNGFDGKVAWFESPRGDIGTLPDFMLGFLRREYAFNRTVRLSDLYPSMASKGMDTVRGHRTYVIEAVARDGVVEKWYLDVRTGLLLRRYLEVVSPEGKNTFEYLYADYRDIGGIKIPFSIQRIWPSMHSIIVTEVMRNLPIEDAKFTKPATK